MHRICKIKLFRVGGWPAGWVAGATEFKAISAFNWVEVEAELGNQWVKYVYIWWNYGCVLDTVGK